MDKIVSTYGAVIVAFVAGLFSFLGLIEAAVHARCDTIVTFNVRDFADAKRFGVRAQTPQQFLTSMKVA